ncbi:hypothetical protein KGR20_24020 [Cytobacillus oceanisediminis]|uniref:Uncharacterized protein n=1 Tax=Niallia alba TaxID=2729105 RepID=A0A7Y0K4P2_9BACI|nr:MULTISPECIES: hypothetical protein [Bacillaceae]MBZ9537211.1 hypothetical protein [Cytobacillus oceanisediminis]NMO75715.1 hypothetical protein [Niallia alba]UTI43510.1 hypothetical protein NKG37_07500 [Niallia sp. RD1]
MDLRKEPSFIHTDERMVLAECDNYYVAVVKLDQQRERDQKYAVILTEDISLREQRDILAKRFCQNNLLMYFVRTIIPEYFLERKMINEVYKAIYRFVYQVK